MQDYQDLISQLPDDDSPAYFGLPDNIERSAQRSNSLRVISQLKTLMRTVEAGAKFDRLLFNGKTLSFLIENQKKSYIQIKKIFRKSSCIFNSVSIFLSQGSMEYGVESNPAVVEAFESRKRKRYPFQNKNAASHERVPYSSVCST